LKAFKALKGLQEPLRALRLKGPLRATHAMKDLEGTGPLQPCLELKAKAIKRIQSSSRLLGPMALKALNGPKALKGLRDPAGPWRPL